MNCSKRQMGGIPAAGKQGILGQAENGLKDVGISGCKLNRFFFVHFWDQGCEMLCSVLCDPEWKDSSSKYLLVSITGPDAAIRGDEETA